MATRIYLPSSGAADVTPTDWEFTSTSGPATYKGLLTPDTSALTNKTCGTGTTSPTLRGSVRYVIGPLAAQTISGSIHGQVQGYESASGANATLAISAKIIQSNGNDRAILLAPTASDLINTIPPEFSTSLDNRRFQDASENEPISLTSQSASDGDYLVIEIGERSATATNRTVYHRIGCDASSGDLPEEASGTTGTTYRGWVEFSANISWQTNDQNINAGGLTVTFSAPAATLVIPHDDFKFIGASAKSTTTTLNYTAQPGNLLVAFVKWEGASGGTGIAALIEAGATSFDLGTLANANTDMHGQIAYLLSSAGGANTYTLNIDGTETWIEWRIAEFEPPTDTTGVTLDAEDSTGGLTGQTATSPEISLGASGAGLVFGGCSWYSQGTMSTLQIPTGSNASVAWNDTNDYGCAFYQKLDSGTGVEATAYSTGSETWVACIAAFKGPVESGTNVDAGGNTVTASNPTASLSLGNIDIQAGAQVVNFTIGGAVAAAVSLATGGGASESDDFNRGDSNGLGTDWTTITIAEFDISSQQVIPDSLSSDTAEFRNDFASAMGNQYAQAKFWITGGSQGNYDGPGLVLRSSNPAGSGNYYRVVVNKYAGGAQAIGIGKFINGSWTPLGTLDLGATWVDGDTLKATITGYVIEVFVNGVSKGTQTDAGQSLATGYPGIAYSSAITSAIIDDWVGGDLAGEGLKVTVTAPDATVTVGQSIAANAQTITFTAPTASVSTGPISVNAGANTVTITAPNVSLTRETNVNANGNTVAVINPVASLGLVASLAAGQALVTFTNPVVTVDTGGTNIAAGQNLVTFTSPDATLDVGGNNVNLNAGANTVTTTCPTVSVATGGVNIVANGNTVTVTSPVASVSIGGVNINAGAVTVTVTCPVATIDLLSPGTNLNAGDQVVVFSNPLASLGLGNANIAGGQNVVNITNPLASISSVVQIAALANTVTITAPTTSYSMGDTQCAAGQNLITFEAPFAYVYIPGTGPAEQSPRATRNRLGKRLDWRHK